MATIPPVKDVMDIYKSRTFSEVYTSYDDSGVLETLTGYTGTCVLKDLTGSAYFTLSTTLNGTGSGLILGGTAGTITLYMHPADTGSLATFVDEDASGVPFATGELVITKSTSNIESYALITFRLHTGY